MLSTFHRLLVALALCHLVAGFRLWFPEHDNGADYLRGYEPPRRSRNQIDRDERQAVGFANKHTSSKISSASKKTTPAPPVFTDEEKEFDDYWNDDFEEEEVKPTEKPSAKPAPSACVWAIVSCCTPGGTTSAPSGRGQRQQLQRIRYACFEAMNCHGAFWDRHPCSRTMMQAALKVTAEFYDSKPK